MNQEVFKNYQRILSKEREQYLQETKKLAPKPIVLDTDFDASLEDIPLTISLPVDTPKEETHKQKSNSVELF